MYSPRSLQMSQVEQVPAYDWEDWVAENDGNVLDVREPDEWALGTLPDSVLLSIGEIIERKDELDSDTPWLVVCHTGGRSQQVATYLAMNGYSTANLAGGMKALGLQD